jgi:hypothetical protein
MWGVHVGLYGSKNPVDLSGNYICVCPLSSDTSFLGILLERRAGWRYLAEHLSKR